MESAILSLSLCGDLQSQNCQNYASSGDLGEISKKGRKSRNAIYRSPTVKKKKRDGNVQRCERVERRKIESGARVSKLQILRKSRARDTQRHLAPSRMHLTAQTMRHRRARRGYIHAARRWVTGVGVHYNQIPEKGGEKN